MRAYYVFSTVLCALFLTLFSQHAMAQKYETQPFEVIESIDGAELRYYPPVMKIQSDNNFGVLFRYISGNNADSKKISMTTPVYMGDEEGNNVMEFVLPASFHKGNTPESTTSSVRVFESEPGYFLAVEFGGYASGSSRQKYSNELVELAKKHGFKPVGEPMLLVYNSPYQFFNRKNEILLALDYQP